MKPPPQQHLTKQTLAGFKWASLSTMLQGVLQFAIFTTLAHLLGPREFGIVGMATIFTNFIERVGFLGIGQALVQREALTERHVRCAFLLCTSFGVLLFAIFYFLAPWVAQFFAEPQLVLVFRLVALSFVFASLAEVSICLLQRELRFKNLLAVTNLAYLMGNGAVGITMALLGYGYWSLVAAIITARAMRVVLALNAKPLHLSLDFGYQEARDLLAIGVGFSLSRFANYCALIGDNFVAGKLLGAQALGLYSRAYQLMTAPATYFGQILEKVLFAALAQRQNEPQKIAQYFIYGIELCSIVSISGAIFLIVAAEEVVSVLFGRHWLEAVPAVKILAFGVFFRTCYKNSDTVLRALGNVYSLALRQAFYAALVIVGAIFGSRWGIEGISCAVLLAVFLNYAMLSCLCTRALDLNVARFAQAHLPAFWLGAGEYMALSSFLQLARPLQLSPIISLGFAGFIFCGLALILFWFAPKAARPGVFTWIALNISMQRLGLIGAWAKVWLLR